MSKHYSIEEVFKFCGEWLNPEYSNSRENRKNKRHREEFDGFLVKPYSERYQTFYNKGIKCSKCGIEGKYFMLEPHAGDEETNIRHFNLYTADGILMTKDHIIPRSKGGKNHISNYQTMCCSCNEKKGNENAI